MKTTDVLENLDALYDEFYTLRKAYDSVVSDYNRGSYDNKNSLYISELLDLRDKFTDLRAAGTDFRAFMIEISNERSDAHRSAYRGQLSYYACKEWQEENPTKKMTGVVESMINKESMTSEDYKNFLKEQSKFKGAKAKIDDTFVDIENFINSTAARLAKVYTKSNS